MKTVLHEVGLTAYQGSSLALLLSWVINFLIISLRLYNSVQPKISYFYCDIIQSFNSSGHFHLSTYLRKGSLHLKKKKKKQEQFQATMLKTRQNLVNMDLFFSFSTCSSPGA